MKLASGQQWAHFIQIQTEIYILFPVIAMQSTEFLKATHKISERAELKLDCMFLSSIPADKNAEIIKYNETLKKFVVFVFLI